MAGGMNKRGNWGTLEERTAANRASDAARAPQTSAPPPGATRPPAPPEPFTPRHPALPPRPAPPRDLKHVWVTDRHGTRLPGLLLKWRNATGQPESWEGLVVHAIHEDSGWAVVEEWLPRGFLDPA